MTTLNRFLLLVAASSVLLTTSPGAVTAFYYDSGANGSYVAGGTSSVLIEPNFAWVFQGPERAYPTGEAVRMNIVGPSSSSRWEIAAEMPFGAMIGVGNYIGVRFPFNSDHFSGFDWSGSGRGLNTLTAFWNVLEAGYDANGLLTAVAIDFIQYEETWDEIDLSKLIANHNQSSFGSYRYNSGIPINTSGNLSIPEPSSAMLITLFASWMACRDAFANQRTPPAEQGAAGQPLGLSRSDDHSWCEPEPPHSPAAPPQRCQRLTFGSNTPMSTPPELPSASSPTGKQRLLGMTLVAAVYVTQWFAFMILGRLLAGSALGLIIVPVILIPGWLVSGWILSSLVISGATSGMRCFMGLVIALFTTFLVVAAGLSYLNNHPPTFNGP